jgi:hypothetical protein
MHGGTAYTSRSYSQYRLALQALCGPARGPPLYNAIEAHVQTVTDCTPRRDACRRRTCSLNRTEIAGRLHHKLIIYDEIVLQCSISTQPSKDLLKFKFAKVSRNSGAVVQDDFGLLHTEPLRRRAGGPEDACAVGAWD